MTLDPLVDKLVALAIEEDLALGDVTTEATIAAATRGVGRIRAKEELVVAGTDVAERVFAAVDPDIEIAWALGDGDAAARGDTIGTARGPVRSLLMAERAVLNFMQRLSGVATQARAFADAVRGTSARVVDTRKTTPGWRTLEKRAVAAGGCFNHRWSLGSGILIKDNHVDSGGGVAAVIARVRLDTLRRCADRARAAGVLSEASGGVVLETVRAIAETGVDLISAGALTHSAPSMDINMKVKPK